MAQIVLGLGTSHSPLLLLAAEEWALRATDDQSGRVPLNLLDGRFVSYAELARLTGAPHGAAATVANFQRQAATAQHALDRLAAALAAARPDVVVIVGDDQGELFDSDNIPAIHVYNGDEIVMRPFHSGRSSMPWAGAEFYRGYARDAAHRFPGAPALATDIIRGLIDAGIDVAMSSRVPEPDRHGFGHAIGFVVQRLFNGRSIPIVPVLLNTYFPPNNPTPRRCLEIGAALKSALEASALPLRVAIVASGGLSHFICEEAFDQAILAALRSHDAPALARIDPRSLVAGSSEIRNWILVAGAIPHLTQRWEAYVPVRRTPAGSGIGLAFMEWS